MIVGNSPNNPYEINIHGFPSTRQLTKYDGVSPDSSWIPYVKQRIENIFSKNPNVERMTIKTFLETPQFAESNTNNGAVEPARVKDKVKDPLPPYDSITARRPRDPLNPGTLSEPGISNKYPINGLRRSVDYVDSKNRLFKNKRREWGFREKVLQGYPEYKPFFGNQTVTQKPKIIVGIVTAGSGVFSGIPSTSNIRYDNSEIYRSVEIGPLRSTENPIVPTGLCFIQDDTGGLGIALGTDIRYIYHPTLYNTNFSNPNIPEDDMHMGSIVIPKADYRQFLRIGDLVVIEVGTNFKYWHAVLGSEPRYWEELWVPESMKIQREEYLSGGVKNYRNVIQNTSIDRKPGKKRRPYVDNWGAYEGKPLNEQYVLPQFLGRDTVPRGVWPNTYSFYPIQEDHPWSTGVPIPVNTGMPYIMMEQFIVDETDRISPTPYVITASELRGFPTLDNPKRLGEIDSDLAWKNPDNNPWIQSQGSKYKGMLVQLKNVRFVLPPKKMQIGAKTAPLTQLESENDINNKFPLDKTDRITAVGGSPNSINRLSFSIQTENLNQFKVGDNIVMASNISYSRGDRNNRMIGKVTSIQKFQPIGRVDPSRVNDKFDITADFSISLGNGTFSDWVVYRPLNIDDVNRVSTIDNSQVKSIEKLSADLDSIMEKLKSGTPIKDLKININGKDYTNFKSIGEAQLLTFYRNGIDSRGFEFNYDERSLKNWTDSGFDVVNEFLVPIALSIADYYTYGAASRVYSYVVNLIDSKEWDIEVDGDISNYLKYEFLELESPFPKSIDSVDGGYWWANPSIPLTNARSHYKDNKESETEQFGMLDSRDFFTQLISSNKLPEVEDRFVRDLGSQYSSSYSPFADEWKPSVMINGQLVMNEFKSMPSGSYFVGNRIYYVADEHNVVIPIRINSNTEIARYELSIPTGSVDITGIAWQYSLGKPGLEWEREAYMMQIWPRFASDISKRPEISQKVDREVEKKDRGEEIQRKPKITRLPDFTLNLGDAIPLSNINSLDCERIGMFLNSRNETIIKTGSNELIAGCAALQNGQEMYVIIESDVWYGLTRTFYFRKDENGNCSCLLVPKGTNKGGII
jgi:hypothetical protein